MLFMHHYVTSKAEEVFFWPGSSYLSAAAVQASMPVSFAVLYSTRSMGKN